MDRGKEKHREEKSGPNALIIHLMLISILCMQQSSGDSMHVCYSVWGPVYKSWCAYKWLSCSPVGTCVKVHLHCAAA